MQPGMTPAERVTLPREIDPAAAIRAELQTRLGASRYQMWCENRISLTLEGERLTVGVASPFLLNWMQKQFRGAMSEAAQAVIGPAAQIAFEVDGSLSALKMLPEGKTVCGDAVLPAHITPPANSLGKVCAVQSHKHDPAPQRVRKLAELGDFVVGVSNQLAWAASQQLATGASVLFNPLYLHGGVGTGKTHLLEGICRELRKHQPALNIVLLTAEAFANYFTQALRDRSLPAFRQKFRLVDVLLVDDVDFFEGKQVIQEEFLHTVADLMDHGRRVVLTGDRHPRLLTKLSEGLTTRIVAGMVCRLEPPDADLRRRILATKAARHSVAFADDVLDYVAQRFQSNVRELEGALHCLQTYGEMTKRPITVAAAREVLCDLEQDCKRIIRLADIEQAVCRLFGLTGRELKSERRSRAISRPRMLAMYLARKHTASAYTEIGEHFGGRNHSTVMSAERKVHEWLSSHEVFDVAASRWPVQDIIGTLEQQLLAG